MSVEDDIEAFFIFYFTYLNGIEIQEPLVDTRKIVQQGKLLLGPVHTSIFPCAESNA